jgi:sulfur-carrier protein adenylyltransferase/sulfurtransferase
VIWYLENYRRSRREREALETLAAGTDWLTPLEWRVDDSLRLIWDAEIHAAGSTFPISVRYPNHFPHSPPVVLPRGDQTRWSAHQYGPGGELCLEFGADNWHPDITGADMVASAHRLLEGERPSVDERAIVASRHRTTVGQELRGKWMRLFMTAELGKQIGKVPDGIALPVTLAGMFHEEAFVYLVASIGTDESERWTDDALPSSLIYESYERRAVLFRWPAGVKLPSTHSVTDFRAAVAAAGLSVPDSNKHMLLVQDSTLRGFYLNENNDAVTNMSVIAPQEERPRLDQHHANLAQRKVAIVGCGSLGSKLAAMLARSGVGKFLLIDDDVFFAGNIVRNDLDWREIATHKVDSVARKVQLVNPSAACDKRRHRLGGQEASGSIESLIEGLASCDLMVDCTADPAVFNYLCAAVSFAKKPLLWAEVFGGGIGGLIARYRPLQEPDPPRMRQAIENWCLERGKPIERAAIDYGGTPKAPLIADDADVTVIASHAARMAIDLLIPRDPSAFPNSVYLIGLTKGWIFEYPFETYPIDVGPPEVAQAEEAIDPQEAATELARILQLFSRQNAASPDAKDTETPST